MIRISGISCEVLSNAHIWNFLTFSSDKDQAEKKKPQKYFLKSRGKTFFIAELLEHDENILVHTSSCQVFYYITSIFLRRTLNWNCCDRDVHCTGSYIIWDLKNTDTQTHTHKHTHTHTHAITKNFRKNCNNHEKSW